MPTRLLPVCESRNANDTARICGDSLAAILGESEPTARQQKVRQVLADFPSHHDYVEIWLHQHSVGADSLAENRGDEPPLSEAEERTIGPYTLIERIGRGGMGEVFVAEQKEPVQRRVALKLIKIGMDSEAAVQRFRRERQVLASMNHEAIAKVFDAGIASHGRPYFVMEYVEGGKPITDYCDEHRLSIPERIQLFQLVCQGVQHSHQRQVLHRDLKPANILVRKVGDRHVPKIIDFGLAKAIAGGDLADGASVHSLQGDLVGTLAYMPPEQAAGEPDLTTAIDVYSLGVVLYELLSGLLPFDLWKLSKAERVRRIREDEPKKPSTRITEASAAAAVTVALAMQRRLRSVRAWSRVVQGDLDWIVLKAMAKEKERRYASATEFAEDLQRYLDHEPVRARAPSFGYRVSKFVRRYRGQMMAASAVLVALVGGGIGTFVQYLRAENRAKELEQVLTFQEAQWEEVDPATMGVRLHRAVLASTKDERRAELESSLAGVNFTGLALGMLQENLFDTSLAAIGKGFAEQPLVKARLLQNVANALRELGLLHPALSAQTEALAIRRQFLGDNDPDTLPSIGNMGLLLQAQDRLNEAEPILREVLATSRRVLGDDHKNTLTSIINVGVLLRDQGKLTEAEPLLREALVASRRILGDDHENTLTSISNMGGLLQEQGKLTEAEPLLREALEKRRRILGDGHPHTLISLVNVGVLLQQQGKLRDAEPVLREALATCRRVLGDDHPHSLESISSMGILLIAQQKRVLPVSVCSGEILHRNATVA